MLIRLVIAWMLGLLLAHQFAAVTFWHWLGLVGLLLLTVGLFRRRQRARHWVILLLVLSLGALRYAAAGQPLGPTSIVTLAEQGEVTLFGAVADDPRRSDESQRLVLRVEAVALAGQARAAEGLVQVSLPPFPAYAYGQRLQMTGTLSQPRAASRPGEFDYRAYLAHRGIFVVLNKPQNVQQRTGSAGLAPLAALLVFREDCRRLIMRTLPEPQAALAVGILLGIQASMPDELYAAFSATGTSHILVVSGWNFTIVAGVLGGFAARARLGRGPTLILALVVMWIYALFTGASAAVLRAAAMASLAAVGRAAERESEPWHLLFAGCGLISLADPHAPWDLGFQLSALATASLFAYAKPVEAWFMARRPFCWPWMALINEALTATMAAQVLTLPLILYQFGNLSIVSPLANIVIVPVVPYAMAAGCLTLAGALIWLPLGQFLGPLAWLPLAWMSAGAMALSAPRWAAVQIPPFPLWALLACYAAIGLRWWLKASREKHHEMG
ncbi:MAG: ComEC/Rec2 family competence protein [Oscillochloridaceae bacterium umkhey_bin13]